MSVTDSDKPLGLWRKGAGVVAENTTSTDAVQKPFECGDFVLQFTNEAIAKVHALVLCGTGRYLCCREAERQIDYNRIIKKQAYRPVDMPVNNG
jgi:hypothetical protein